MATYMHYWSGLSVALATIAGLTPEHHEIIIIDENQEQIDFEKYYGYDIVGITAMTQQAPRAYQIAENFRERGIYVVIGGIHATVLPEETKQHADTVFAGEAEKTWPLFINDFLLGKQKEYYDQKNYDAINMADIPTPRFDLIGKYKYPVVWMQTTRGCPHDCEFCAASVIYGRTYKRKSIKQVIREIEEIKKHWKFVQIGFADDNMFVDRNFSKQLISNFKNLNFNWFAQTDISIGNDEALLDLLRANGCKYVFIGFEGTSKNKLEILNKNHWKAKKFDEYKDYIDIIQKKGIGIFGSFILGFDDDDAGIFDDTINYIIDNNLMGASITILTPFPGSRLRERMSSENRILHDDWDYYTAWNAVIKHKNLSVEQLEEGLMRVYSGIYNNKDVYIKRAKYFKNILESIINQ
jgi:radical SAM superfamily enzyme YgiQ (UPF0313 family)